MDRLATIDVSGDDRIPLATIRGEIDLSNAAELEVAAADAVANNAQGLVVDLAAVDYLDSSGIGLLFNLARRLARRRQGFAIVAPGQAPVRQILEVTGVSETLEVHDDLDAAIHSLDDAV
jgi:anti-anti-sigma factor